MTSTIKLGATAMPLLAAESTFEGVKSSALGEQLVIIAALLLIGKIIWDFSDRFRGGLPQKNEVSFADQFPTREQCTERHTLLKKEVDKIDHERRTSAAELHKRIELVERNLNERIDEIPSRTIALLNETKQLHHK